MTMKFPVEFKQPAFRRALHFWGDGHLHVLELALVLDGMLTHRTTSWYPFSGIIYTHTTRTIPFAKILSVKPHARDRGSYNVYFRWPKAPLAGLPGTFQERIILVRFRVLERDDQFSASLQERLTVVRANVSPPSRITNAH